MKNQFTITTKRRNETTKYVFDASELRGSKELFIIRYWKHYVEDKENSNVKEMVVNIDNTIYEDYYKCLRAEFAMLDERQRNKINDWLKSLWDR